MKYTDFGVPADGKQVMIKRMRQFQAAKMRVDKLGSKASRKDIEIVYGKKLTNW